MSVPLPLQARMLALLTRMTAQGLTEPVQVWGTQTMRNAAGRAIKRQEVLLGTLTGYVEVKTGSEELDQEGARYTAAHQLYYLPGQTGSDGTPLLTDATYRTRWVVLPQRANEAWRVASCQSYGPYVSCLLVEGGRADLAGNVR